MPSKPAPCGEGRDGSKGLKPRVLGDALLPPENGEEIPTWQQPLFASPDALGLLAMV